jgi:hypothetical protein
MIRATSFVAFLIAVSVGLAAHAEETGGNGSAALPPSGNAAK